MLVSIIVAVVVQIPDIKLLSLDDNFVVVFLGLSESDISFILQWANLLAS